MIELRNTTINLSNVYYSSQVNRLTEIGLSKRWADHWPVP